MANVTKKSGDNGERLKLRWAWRNAMKNSGERDDARIKSPKFNHKFDAMQEELFRSFWDFGVDKKKLSATSILCVVGTPNMKTKKSDEILMYQEFVQRLGNKTIRKLRLKKLKLLKFKKNVQEVC